ncbi:uncharacterized protein LOC114275897, partial [Camellia sinensis]|uniref:uncharacterized protein LOC114275897 n=1 Tax=Camellia sinensis TaxID=4442 RepID=UPI00103674F1
MATETVLSAGNANPTSASVVVHSPVITSLPTTVSVGHRAKDCRNCKDQQDPFKKTKYEQAHITELETLPNEVTEMNLVAVVSEDSVYVGKGYLCDGLFKMNVLTVIPSINKNTTSSAYLFESSHLWRKIKALRSDRGDEYDAPFGTLCSQLGIIHQTTAPYAPQQNGVAERKNHTLKEMMNAMLISS